MRARHLIDPEVASRQRERMLSLVMRLDAVVFRWGQLLIATDHRGRLRAVAVVVDAAGGHATRRDDQSLLIARPGDPDLCLTCTKPVEPGYSYCRGHREYQLRYRREILGKKAKA